jgi:hypothetical protein
MNISMYTNNSPNELPSMLLHNRSQPLALSARCAVSCFVDEDELFIQEKPRACRRMRQKTSLLAFLGCAFRRVLLHVPALFGCAFRRLLLHVPALLGCACRRCSVLCLLAFLALFVYQHVCIYVLCLRCVYMYTACINTCIHAQFYCICGNMASIYF